MSEPIHIISLGAGVQSSTMALMAAHGEITPMPKCAIFADTQDEPQSVYKWLDWLEKQLPFPVHRVTAGKLSETVTNVRPRKDGKGGWIRGNIPAYTINSDGSYGHLGRACTYDFKIIPLTKMQRRLGNITRAQKTIGVISWIGISRDEAHRMKPPREPWIEHRWPLIEKDFTRTTCLVWMKVNGYPTPPRSACVYCPYHSDNEWRRLRKEEPEEFRKAVGFEILLQGAFAETGTKDGVPYLHNSRIPLSQVDFSTDEDHGQQVMFGNECEGMCGV